MPTAGLLALEELARVLEALGIPFVVGGSLASGAWGEPRSTHDVDLLIQLEAEQVPALVRALEGRFYVDEGSVREATQEARAFNVIHLGHFQKLDLFVAGDSALDAAQLAGAVDRKLAEDQERTFPVTSPEVVVLRKLDWYRRGGGTSDRQWRDVLAVLRVQGDRLDVGVMRDLAEATDLTSLLDRALSDAWGAGSG